MKLWLSAQEIADLKLDGFPASKRGVQIVAARNNWAASAYARKREGREGGGGLEYHIDLLPLPQRLQYAGTFVCVKPEDYLTETSSGLTRRACDARDARLIVLKVAERFRKRNGMGEKASDHLFCELFGEDKVPLPEWVLKAVKTISIRTLYRWRKDMREDLNRLAYDASKARKGTGVLDRAEDGRVRNFCLAVHASNQFLSAKHIRNTALAEFGETLLITSGKTQKRVPMPPLRTFQSALKAWKAEYRNELLKMTDPDAYKSKVRFSARGANRVQRLNQTWEIDASPSDILLDDLSRPNIYAAIDLYSRRTILLVTTTPRAAGVGLLIRKCILAWGVPEIIKTDNGSDFTAHATVRLLESLGIEQELTAPYSPEKKGSVERVIGTFQRDCAATLPGFIGHSVADRKVIEARKSFSKRLGTDDAKLFQAEIGAAEYQKEADRWAQQQYAHTPHSGLKGKTPDAVARAWTADVRAIDNPGVLDVLLAPIASNNGLRKVSSGGIRIDNEFYSTFDVMPGQNVFCRHDPSDLGRIWLFDPEGETYLGEAVNPDLAGLDPVAWTKYVQAKQKEHYAERSAGIRKEIKKITPRTVMEAQRAAYQHNADVLSFPQKRQGHETAKTFAASEVKKKRAPRELSDREAAMMARLKAEEATDAKPSATIHQMSNLETPEARFKRALQLEQRLSEGIQLADQDALWLTGYQAGPEYRAHKMIWKDTHERECSVPPAS